MMKEKARSALACLSDAEKAEVLLALLRAHPRLRPEAQRLATGLLDAQDRAAVAMDVTDGLRALQLRDLADRAGPQWGGGYVEPHEAADELLTDAIQPFVDDLERRARIGAVAAATEIGLGLLLGNMRAVTRTTTTASSPTLGCPMRSTTSPHG